MKGVIIEGKHLAEYLLDKTSVDTLNEQSQKYFKGLPKTTQDFYWIHKVENKILTVINKEIRVVFQNCLIDDWCFQENRWSRI